MLDKILSSLWLKIKISLLFCSDREGNYQRTIPARFGIIWLSVELWPGGLKTINKFVTYKYMYPTKHCINTIYKVARTVVAEMVW